MFLFITMQIIIFPQEPVRGKWMGKDHNSASLPSSFIDVAAAAILATIPCRDCHHSLDSIEGNPCPDAISWDPRQTAVCITSSSVPFYSSYRLVLHRKFSSSHPTMGFLEFLWVVVENFPQLCQPLSTLWVNTTNSSLSPLLNGQIANSARVLLWPLQPFLLWRLLQHGRYNFSKSLQLLPYKYPLIWVFA